jgi:hypothetical protein
MAWPRGQENPLEFRGSSRKVACSSRLGPRQSTLLGGQAAFGNLLMRLGWLKWVHWRLAVVDPVSDTRLELEGIPKLSLLPGLPRQGTDQFIHELDEVRRAH